MPGFAIKTTLCLLVGLFSLSAASQINYDGLTRHSYTLDTLHESTSYERDLVGYIYKEGLRKNFKILGKEQGLGLSLVISMLEDRFGRIWMGGGEGEICVFDGRKFIYYRVPGMVDNVYDIEEDVNGKIWFTTNGSGIYCFNGQHFCLARFPEEDLDDAKLFSWSMDLDQSGRLLVGTHRHGLLSITENDYTRIDTSYGLPDMSVTAINVDSSNRLWLGHYSRGVSLVEFGRVESITHPEHLPTNRVYSLAEYDSSTTAIGTRQGLALVDSKHGNVTSSQHLPAHVVDEMVVDGQNRLWVGINNRHGCYKLENGKWQQFTEKDGLSSDRIMSLLVDSEENLWLGTFGKGVVKHEPDVFENFNKSSGLTDNKIWALLPFDGGLLAGGHGGIAYLKEDSIEVLDIIPELVNDEVYDLYEDRDGYLWISAKNRGIYRVSPDRQYQLFPYPDTRNTHWVFDIHQSSFGHMYFAGYSGLMTIALDTLRHVNAGGDPITSALNCIAESPNGDLWLGSRNESILHPQGLLGRDFSMMTDVRPSLGKDQATGEIKDILLDGDDIWFSFYRRGVYHANIRGLEGDEPLDLHVINMEEGLPSDNVEPLVKDSNGLIWVGTGAGVCSITQTDTGYDVRTYGTQFGLIDTEIIYSNAFEDENGYIWWSTTTFLSKYYPERDHFDVTPPKLSLTDLKLFFKDVEWDDRNKAGCAEDESYLSSLFGGYRYYKDVDPWTHLPISPVFSYDQNDLQFEYAATNWDRESQILYQVKLEGQDEDWNPETRSVTKDYLSLGSGEYVLHIKARNADGIWSEPVSYPFVIMPPFWETVWFIVLVGLIVLIAIVVYIRVRVKRLQKENIVLENKVLERTEQLVREKKKSDDLLLNILPASTAEELKERGTAKTRNFDSASVLFSDFKGFTTLTQTMDSPTLVENLDHFFKAYDEASQKYAIEKIKTIGDAYMCASGIPDAADDHAVRLVAFGLEMLVTTESINSMLSLHDEDMWHIRVGIHSGPLIAGVVGKKKFSFDIWGDTVNTAARMEQNSEPARVNVSAATRELLRDYFTIEERGKVKAKGKGELDMFYVVGFAREFASEIDPRIPNNRFLDQFSMRKMVKSPS